MKVYNKILENIILPSGDWITGGSLIKELRKWRKYSSMHPNEIDYISRQNLERVLSYAVDNIPYYQGIDKNPDPYLMLKNFPVLYKKDINENIDLLTSVDPAKLIGFSGSGSSGVRTTVYVSKKELSTSRAIQTHWWEWSGYYIGKKLFQTGMSEKRTGVKRLKDILFRTRYVQAFKLGQQEIESLLRKQAGKTGYHLGGYASSLNVLAVTARKYGINNVSFDGAISWGDKLFDGYRANISEVFGCKTFDNYGCSEGLMVAAKKDLDYYYIMSPHVHLEIVDKEGNEVPNGELGYVLLTRLDNYSMPLIRYYVGDLAVKLPREKYPRERELPYPLLEKVIGRDTDIVRTPSGKYMIVHFFTGIFENIKEVTQFRVIQRTLEQIEIEYIPADDFSEECLERVESIIYRHLDEKYPIQWIKVDHIPATPSGKPQIIQSFLK